jgi:hypothetical protein
VGKKLCAPAVLVIAVASLVPLASAHSKPSLATVLAHTRAAGRALDRAVSEFDAHALSAGRSNFGKNRRQMGLAVAEKAALIQEGTTPAERLAAAKAVVSVARQARVDELAFARTTRALPRGSKLQLRVIRAAATDTARSNALGVLNDLLASVPDAAQSGIAKAIAQLTLAHAPAVAQLRKDVTSKAVGRTAKGVAADDIRADVRGQAHAINLLQALEPLLPEEAQTGIETALAAIAKSLDAQAKALAAVKPHAPARLRDELAAAIAKAHAAADDASG